MSNLLLPTALNLSSNPDGAEMNIFYGSLPPYKHDRDGVVAVADSMQEPMMPDQISANPNLSSQLQEAHENKSRIIILPNHIHAEDQFNVLIALNGLKTARE